MSKSQFFNFNTCFILISICLTISHTPQSFADNLKTQPYSVTRVINVEITTHLGDNQTFLAGDTLSFLVNLDHDAYLLVIYETADKQLIQLFPNDYANNNIYQAGSFVQVPNNMLRKKFEIASPFGKEKVYAFASSESFPNLEGKQLDNGLFHITNPISKIIQKLRKHVDGRNIAYGENYLTITTSQN